MPSVMRCRVPTHFAGAPATAAVSSVVASEGGLEDGLEGLAGEGALGDEPRGLGERLGLRPAARRLLGELVELRRLLREAAGDLAHPAERGPDEDRRDRTEASADDQRGIPLEVTGEAEQRRVDDDRADPGDHAGALPERPADRGDGQDGEHRDGGPPLRVERHEGEEVRERDRDRDQTRSPRPCEGLPGPALERAGETHRSHARESFSIRQRRGSPRRGKQLMGAFRAPR